MKKQRFILTLILLAIFISAIVSFAGAEGTTRIAMLVKNLGNAFFEACRDGGLEAAKELGGIELIYQGPTTPTAEGQIEIIDSLIAQKVNAIVVSANDVMPWCLFAKGQCRAGLQ
jgi:rhamnose transport system substrate-binding protein